MLQKKEKRACKPGSVLLPVGSEAAIYLRGLPERFETDHFFPQGELSLLGLAPGGVYLPRMLPCRAVGSYPTFSHLTPRVSAGRSILCGTCRFRYEPEPLFNTRHPVLWCPDFPLPKERLPGPFLIFTRVRQPTRAQLALIIALSGVSHLARFLVGVKNYAASFYELPIHKLREHTENR